MELAYTLVVLVGALHTMFEELSGEGYAMFGFTVPGVREVGNNVSNSMHVLVSRTFVRLFAM